MVKCSFVLLRDKGKDLDAFKAEWGDMWWMTANRRMVYIQNKKKRIIVVRDSGAGKYYHYIRVDVVYVLDSIRQDRLMSPDYSFTINSRFPYDYEQLIADCKHYHTSV